MYQVIIIFDELREKSYFGSYFISEDTALGNITCEELPPFADINKAHACYWNAEEEQWVFDSERYAEIMEQLTAEKEAAEKAEAEAKAVPTNAELGLAVMELAGNQALIMDAIAKINACMATGKEEK